jgi:hypothetical protein
MVSPASLAITRDEFALAAEAAAFAASTKQKATSQSLKPAQAGLVAAGH